MIIEKEIIRSGGRGPGGGEFRGPGNGGFRGPVNGGFNRGGGFNNGFNNGDRFNNGGITIIRKEIIRG